MARMLYAIVLGLHSVLRWVVLAAGGWALYRARRGKTQGLVYEAADRRAALIFVASLHLSAVLGLLLYTSVSPLTTAYFGQFGAAMKVGAVRFFLVEHPFGMLLGVILVTIGSARVKRATSDALKHKRALLFFGLGLLAIVLSIPWPFYPAARPLLPL